MQPHHHASDQDPSPHQAAAPVGELRGVHLSGIARGGDDCGRPVAVRGEDDSAGGGCLVALCLLGFVCVAALSVIVSSLPPILEAVAKVLRIFLEIFLFPQPL